MAPIGYIVENEYSIDEPRSRTYQYRKVMKPLLERKRRARINKCLDELKEFMVTALQNDGENVSKLEKADILELTVKYLQNLNRQHQLVVAANQSYNDKYKAGFKQCASEVSHFIGTPARENSMPGNKIMQHLSNCLNQIDDKQSFSSQSQYQRCYTPPDSPQLEEVIQPQAPWRPW